jgi:hypothetical protein
MPYHDIPNDSSIHHSEQNNQNHKNSIIVETTPRLDIRRIPHKTMIDEHRLRRVPVSNIKAPVILKRPSEVEKAPVDRRLGIMRVADPSAGRIPDGGSIAHYPSVNEWKAGILG